MGNDAECNNTGWIFYYRHLANAYGTSLSRCKHGYQCSRFLNCSCLPQASRGCATNYKAKSGQSATKRVAPRLAEAAKQQHRTRGSCAVGYWPWHGRVQPLSPCAGSRWHSHERSQCIAGHQRRGGFVLQ